MCILCVYVYIQHHQATQLAEGMVRDVADMVKGESHGLQGGQVTQSLHWHLHQGVIVQPQVTEGTHAGETAGGNAGDVVGVQATTERLNIAWGYKFSQV